jgi:hypothetical protein
VDHVQWFDDVDGELDENGLFLMPTSSFALSFLAISKQVDAVHAERY